MKVKVNSLSRVWLSATPWTVACLGFSRHSYTGVGCHFLLQRIFPTQRLNLGLPYCRQMLYCLSHFSLLCRVHHSKCWAEWITSWNQDCREKYQQPQKCRWYHSNDRKQRGTKEPLDEGGWGEWKSWLKTKIQKAKIPSLHGKQKEKKWKHWQISMGSKITADSDYGHEIKRHLFLEGKLWQI